MERQLIIWRMCSLPNKPDVGMILPFSRQVAANPFNKSTSICLITRQLCIKLMLGLLFSLSWLPYGVIQLPWIEIIQASTPPFAHHFPHLLLSIYIIASIKLTLTDRPCRKKNIICTLKHSAQFVI